ncbi:uncharacterized protein J4E78_006649 [Alternaria triticimaculans]|uniref:uncharacterized protein n=1 Tax=Alternaria triticimaculans TaxID=297637 RepID=UPI0020C22BDD|nr:uncharacterized protein J4E78_006649 [Alternaria triticimaculans]KAI4656758.1 hypothetical protein J4E78_006649 [Alternaria triticimaculans]
MAARLFRKRFEDAEALFDSGDIAGCILAAQRNITAMDNWDDGNDWRLAAESTFSNVSRRAREINDTNSLAALQDLREELDWLARQRDEYLQEYKAWMLEQEGEDDDGETDSEADGVELDDSENEAEMEAEGIKSGEGNARVDVGDTRLLPIRGHQAPTASLVVNREDERSSSILAATAFLFECQSYIPEHMQGQYTQAVLELQEAAMGSINSMSSTASAA